MLVLGGQQCGVVVLCRTCSGLAVAGELERTICEIAAPEQREASGKVTVFLASRYACERANTMCSKTRRTHGPLPRPSPVRSDGQPLIESAQPCRINSTSPSCTA